MENNAELASPGKIPASVGPIPVLNRRLHRGIGILDPEGQAAQ